MSGSDRHFSFQGDEAPDDADPYTLGKDGKRRKNPTQFIPRMSADAGATQEQWQDFQAVMEPVFAWLAGEVCSSLLFSS